MSQFKWAVIVFVFVASTARLAAQEPTPARPQTAAALTVSILERMDKRLDATHQQITRDLGEMRGVQKETLRELGQLLQRTEALERRVAALEAKSVGAPKPSEPPAKADLLRAAPADVVRTVWRPETAPPPLAAAVKSPPAAPALPYAATARPPGVVPPPFPFPAGTYQRYVIVPVGDPCKCP